MAWVAGVFVGASSADEAERKGLLHGPLLLFTHCLQPGKDVGNGFAACRHLPLLQQVKRRPRQ